MAPVTKTGLGRTLAILAMYRKEPSPAVTELMRRAALDEDTFMMGVFNAVLYGAVSMLKILTEERNIRDLHPLDVDRSQSLF